MRRLISIPNMDWNTCRKMLVTVREAYGLKAGKTERFRMSNKDNKTSIQNATRFLNALDMILAKNFALGRRLEGLLAVVGPKDVNLELEEATGYSVSMDVPAQIPIVVSRDAEIGLFRLPQLVFRKFMEARKAGCLDHFLMHAIGKGEVCYQGISSAIQSYEPRTGLVDIPNIDSESKYRSNLEHQWMSSTNGSLEGFEDFFAEWPYVDYLLSQFENVQVERCRLMYQDVVVGFKDFEPSTIIQKDEFKTSVFGNRRLPQYWRGFVGYLRHHGFDDDGIRKHVNQAIANFNEEIGEDEDKLQFQFDSIMEGSAESRFRRVFETDKLAHRVETPNGDQAGLMATIGKIFNPTNRRFIPVARLHPGLPLATVVDRFNGAGTFIDLSHDDVELLIGSKTNMMSNDFRLISDEPEFIDPTTRNRYVEHELRPATELYDSGGEWEDKVVEMRSRRKGVGSGLPSKYYLKHFFTQEQLMEMDDFEVAADMLKVTIQADHLDLSTPEGIRHLQAHHALMRLSRMPEAERFRYISDAYMTLTPAEVAYYKERCQSTRLDQTESSILMSSAIPYLGVQFVLERPNTFSQSFEMRDWIEVMNGGERVPMYLYSEDDACYAMMNDGDAKALERLIGDMCAYLDQLNEAKLSKNFQLGADVLDPFFSKHDHLKDVDAYISRMVIGHGMIHLLLTSEFEKLKILLQHSKYSRESTMLLVRKMKSMPSHFKNRFFIESNLKVFSELMSSIAIGTKDVSVLNDVLLLVSSYLDRDWLSYLLVNDETFKTLLLKPRTDIKESQACVDARNILFGKMTKMIKFKLALDKVHTFGSVFQASIFMNYINTMARWAANENYVKHKFDVVIFSRVFTRHLNSIQGKETYFTHLFKMIYSKVKDLFRRKPEAALSALLNLLKISGHPAYSSWLRDFSILIDNVLPKRSDLFLSSPQFLYWLRTNFNPFSGTDLSLSSSIMDKLSEASLKKPELLSPEYRVFFRMYSVLRSTSQDEAVNRQIIDDLNTIVKSGESSWIWTMILRPESAEFLEKFLYPLDVMLLLSRVNPTCKVDVPYKHVAIVAEQCSEKITRLNSSSLVAMTNTLSKWSDKSFLNFVDSQEASPLFERIVNFFEDKESMDEKRLNAISKFVVTLFERALSLRSGSWQIDHMEMVCSLKGVVDRISDPSLKDNAKKFIDTNLPSMLNSVVCDSRAFPYPREVALFLFLDDSEYYQDAMAAFKTLSENESHRPFFIHLVFKNLSSLLKYVTKRDNDDDVIKFVRQVLDHLPADYHYIFLECIARPIKVLSSTLDRYPALRMDVYKKFESVIQNFLAKSEEGVAVDVEFLDKYIPDIMENMLLHHTIDSDDGFSKFVDDLLDNYSVLSDLACSLNSPLIGSSIMMRLLSKADTSTDDMLPKIVRCLYIHRAYDYPEVKAAILANQRIMAYDNQNSFASELKMSLKSTGAGTEEDEPSCKPNDLEQSLNNPVTQLNEVEAANQDPSLRGKPKTLDKILTILKNPSSPLYVFVLNSFQNWLTESNYLESVDSKYIVDITTLLAGKAFSKVEVEVLALKTLLKMNHLMVLYRAKNNDAFISILKRMHKQSESLTDDIDRYFNNFIFYSETNPGSVHTELLTEVMRFLVSLPVSDGSISAFFRAIRLLDPDVRVSSDEIKSWLNYLLDTKFKRGLHVSSFCCLNLLVTMKPVVDIFKEDAQGSGEILQKLVEYLRGSDLDTDYHPLYSQQLLNSLDSVKSVRKKIRSFDGVDVVKKPRFRLFRGA